MQLVRDEQGRARCWWGASDPDYLAYHDQEWGYGVIEDHQLFEKICLEGFQAGLSWLTILRKRDRFRAVFAGFDPVAVAAFGENEVEALLGDPGIIRHEAKIRSTINNASRALEMIAELGSLAAFFWRYSRFDPDPPVSIPSTTPQSQELARELKTRGWSFVGPTTAYAFMQAMGLVNDHLEGCLAREAAERSRRAAATRMGITDQGIITGSGTSRE